MVISMSKVSDNEIRELKKKIKELYKNYGIDIGDMNDEELGRIVRQYLSGASDIDIDFLESQRHSDKFSEEELI